ncbi:MAG: putative DNA binding protein [Halobacteriales archaeon]|jgi:predicted DNA binding protein
MSVIVEFDVRATDFELGRVLAVPGRGRIKLQEMIPLGEQVIPLIWLYETDSEEFVDAVRSHEGVDRLIEFDETSDRILYGLHWDMSEDELLSAVSDHGGYLLKGSGSGGTWSLQVRFPDHDSVSSFDDECREKGIGLTATAVYNPTPPEASEWYGLSTAQRETLLLALSEGYYDIPRQISTKELGELLDISDQAVTERLRRAIRTLSENTILTEQRTESATHD